MFFKFYPLGKTLGKYARVISIGSSRFFSPIKNSFLCSTWILTVTAKLITSAENKKFSFTSDANSCYSQCTLWSACISFII